LICHALWQMVARRMVGRTKPLGSQCVLQHVRRINR
jgi:hypothetical protein